MDRQQFLNLSHIQEASRENRLVIFVGAGVSMNSGIPSWNSLIDILKQELPTVYSSETDALKIAQVYKDARGHKEYMDKVKEVLLFNKAVPNPLHRRICSLSPCHIITTNYDDLIEQELANEFLQFHVIREDKDLPQMTFPNTLVKMHGDYAKDNIVLTESDYFNYKDNFPLIRAFIQSLFASKLVLFVGFSFADLNLKMILNELKNILSENMQRAYLLSCEKPEYITRQYFEKKGINVLYLSEKDIDQINGNGYINPGLSGVGLHTDKLLYAINNYCATPHDDLALSLYNKIVPYMNEIRCFGDGLKYFFPKTKGMYWNAHSEGLQTGLDYFKNLAKTLKSNQAKRQFLREHPTISLRKLLQLAYYNYLFEIDRLQIIDEKFWNNITTYIKFPTSYYIHRFDSERVSRMLQELRAKSISYTIEDLELPYTLFLLGDAWNAYQQYLKLIPLYWDKQKYILYFIGRYNLWAIRNHAHFQLMLDDAHNAEKETEFASSNELDVILSKLPLSPEIKKIFQDMISYRFIGSKTLDAGRLKEEIYQQRKAAENGGCSINSNIARLISLYERESLFSWANFIVWENNGYYRLISEYYVLGILNSFATAPSTMFGGRVVGTRVQALSESMLESIIFDIENERLKTIVKVYDIKSLEFSEDGVSYIHSCLDGLLEDHPFIFKDDNKLYTPLHNLLLVVSKSKDDRIDTEKLYSVIVKYQTPRYSIQIPNGIIEDIINIYPPAETSNKNLIERLFYTTNNHQQYTLCIYKLITILKDSSITYNEFKYESLPNKKDLATEISFLYSVTTDELKNAVLDFSLSNISNLYNYMFFIYHQRIESYSPKRFKELLDKEKIEDMERHELYLMAKIRKEQLFENVHCYIDNITPNSDCLRFYLSPLDFEEIEKVDIEWIFKFDDEIKAKLFDKEQYKLKLKDYLVANNLSDRDKRYLLDFL